MIRRPLVAGTCAVLLALILAVPAHSAGENGKVAFTRFACTFQPPTCTSDIWTVNPNGGDVTQLTHLNDAQHPAWSFDGQRLAFSHAGGIYTIREDGADMRHVLDWSLDIGHLSWSPDGSHLAAALTRCDVDECRMDIHTVSIDGTAVTDITPDLYEERNPAWSPDGTRIAFDSLREGAYNIWTIDADGADPTQVTHRTGGGTDSSPAWSRDGDQIAFESDRDGSENGIQLFTMNPDGTQVQRITPPLPPGEPSTDPTFSPDGSQIAFRGARDSGPGIYRMLSNGGSAVALTTNPLDFEPDWQATTESFQILGHYPRPKGATPLVTYFVPAFRACVTPNRTHGPPLADPSCAPPAQVSQQLTIGTRASASARLAVIRGNPATLDDEADVSIELGMLDVYRRSDLSDYAGEIDVRLTVRITDRDNTPATGNDGGGTAGDVTLRLPGSCVPTADASMGGSCALDTTLDSIAPGTVKEGARAVWELAQIQIYDGGADGEASTDPNQLFQVQGVFVP